MLLYVALSQFPPGSPVINGSQVIVLNSQITLTCTSARGNPRPSLKWFMNDLEITSGLSTTTSVSPQAPTLTGPTTLTPGQQGIWTCISANGYPAGIMTMRNKDKNTQFTSEFSSTGVIDQKSYDVTGTLSWNPVISNIGDTICCDVTHTTTLGNTSQTVCRLFSDAREYFQLKSLQLSYHE
ncbi:Hypothetical predicted protein [Mytilus galloprovincialis]|uniref:Ig-like domain-containing protein n=1 Tax=Mytilus galloprovincialis TaxID=29158 RepID=A0A8B6GA52_MYTGA|nr:Hypothetical predicted protein [Mytilus galloprovincialis]